MPELTRLHDCEFEGDYVVAFGDTPGDDPTVSLCVYEGDKSADVILDRTDIARLVVALDGWLQDTSPAKLSEAFAPPPERNTYPEAVPHVVVPDYDAPMETGRALRISAPDGLLNIECGVETVTAYGGDAVSRQFTVNGSTMVQTDALIRALAAVLPLEPGLRVGVLS